MSTRAVIKRPSPNWAQASDVVDTCVRVLYRVARRMEKHSKTRDLTGFEADTLVRVMKAAGEMVELIENPMGRKMRQLALMEPGELMAQIRKMEAIEAQAKGKAIGGEDS